MIYSQVSLQEPPPLHFQPTSQVSLCLPCLQPCASHCFLKCAVPLPASVCSSVLPLLPAKTPDSLFFLAQLVKNMLAVWETWV